MRNANIKHYQKEAFKTRLAAADPYQITQMLMAGCVDNLTLGKAAIERQDLEAKSKHLSKSGSIIDALKMSLDMEVGGEISDNLFALYEYMNNRILDANLENTVEPVDEVINLMKEIKSAWDAIPVEAREQAFTQMEERKVATGG